MDAVRLLGAVLEDSPHNRQSMVQISGALPFSSFHHADLRETGAQLAVFTLMASALLAMRGPRISAAWWLLACVVLRVEERWILATYV